MENIKQSYELQNQSKGPEFNTMDKSSQRGGQTSHNNRKLRRDMHGPKASITKSLIEDASEDFSNIEEHLSSF